LKFKQGTVIQGRPAQEVLLASYATGNDMIITQGQPAKAEMQQEVIQQGQ
jgi:hypothetical protein